MKTKTKTIRASKTTTRRVSASSQQIKAQKTLSATVGDVHRAAVKRVIRKAPITARFDAAQTTNDNSNHWSNSDSLSADAALSPEIRKIVRNRSRYEVANNSYARGIIDTIANDTVGTGCNLQLLTDDRKKNEEIEEKFYEWMCEIRLSQKLRTMRKARAQDGEVFGILTNNPRLDSPVKLDLKLVEADQIATPYTLMNNFYDHQVDGIEFDRYGNPEFYYLLNQHPGDNCRTDDNYKKILAQYVIHLFKADRPGQSRGIPEIMPALPLFAQLRRFTLAVIAAAETAADFAAVIFSDTNATGEPSEDITAMDVVELERRMATVLPAGWKLGQMEAMQPNSTYVEFAKTILNEIARCMQVPFNVAYGNSSGYNYASGRLDWQTYFKNIQVDRSDLEIVCLEPVLRAWHSEAILISDFIPVQWRKFSAFKHQWSWDGREHVDPAKEANAQDTRLKNHSTNHAIEYSKQGKDWQTELRQSVKEVQFLKQLAEEFKVPFEAVLNFTQNQTVTVQKDDEE